MFHPRQVSSRFCMTLLLSCSRGGGDEDADLPTCPQAWEWSGVACVPLMPGTSGTGLDGDVTPLADGDLTEAEQLALAERFEPALVFAGPQAWPVRVAYCATSGADLISYDEADEAHADGTVVVPNAEVSTTDYSILPSDGVVYNMDCPGDNTGPGYEEASWLTEWADLQGDDPATAPFPPTHYAHLAWFDQAQRLLLIQYWTWYPFDKFANNHEGDWEHVNVVVDLASEKPALVDVHWFFHGWSFQSFERVSRVTDADGGDHVVVFAGGCGEFDGWGGCYSGASYPWPGKYVGAALFVVEDTTVQARYLHPDDISVQLLPEPAAVADAPIEVSWLALQIYFGQWEVSANSNAILALGGNEAAPQPVFKGSWDMGLNDDPWLGEDDSSYEWFEPPKGWEMLYNPGHDDGVRSSR